MPHPRDENQSQISHCLVQFIFDQVRRRRDAEPATKSRNDDVNDENVSVNEKCKRGLNSKRREIASEQQKPAAR
jgi:hypothetical protein